jgi:peroxiredoxin
MPEFTRRGVSVLVISFAEPGVLREYQNVQQWPMTMLSDPQRRAYAAFALERLPWRRFFSLATLAMYFKLLQQGSKPGRYGNQDIYQGGGDFLIDHAGHVLFAHRSRDPADRPPAEMLLAHAERATR